MKMLFNALLMRTYVWLFTIRIFAFVHKLIIMNVANNFELIWLELSLLIFIDFNIIMYFICDHVHFEYVFKLWRIIVLYFDVCGTILADLHAISILI